MFRLRASSPEPSWDSHRCGTSVARYWLRAVRADCQLGNERNKCRGQHRRSSVALCLVRECLLDTLVVRLAGHVGPVRRVGCDELATRRNVAHPDGLPG
jgi:hypothetical protein